MKRTAEKTACEFLGADDQFAEPRAEALRLAARSGEIGFHGGCELAAQGLGLLQGRAKVVDILGRRLDGLRGGREGFGDRRAGLFGALGDLFFGGIERAKVGDGVAHLDFDHAL